MGFGVTTRLGSQLCHYLASYYFLRLSLLFHKMSSALYIKHSLFFTKAFEKNIWISLSFIAFKNSCYLIFKSSSLFPLFSCHGADHKNKKSYLEFHEYEILILLSSVYMFHKVIFCHGDTSIKYNTLIKFMCHNIFLW